MSPGQGEGRREGVVVVGAGERFTSGISHYTRYVATALADRVPTAAILVRRLIPTALYPGRARVGTKLSEATYPDSVEVFDGIDWYSPVSLARASRFLARRRPRVFLMQWWTGSVLHSYLYLAHAARRQGVRVIIELHEIQDTGEAAFAPARLYTEGLGGVLMGMADAFIVHSEHDRRALEEARDIGSRPVEVIRHGPYDHYEVAEAVARRDAPATACNILYFGTIRPYKGLEYLVEAFDELLARHPSGDFWLTVVGETWEGWTQPLELIKASPNRDRITVVNRYVTDAEAAGWFAGADAVALPYLRSSASGPLHMTMSAGLPVIITDVGGLAEAAEGYGGATFVPPRDSTALADAMAAVATSPDRRFDDHGSWAETAERITALIDRLG